MNRSMCATARPGPLISHTEWRRLPRQPWKSRDEDSRALVSQCGKEHPADPFTYLQVYLTVETVFLFSPCGIICNLQLHLVLLELSFLYSWITRPITPNFSPYTFGVFFLSVGTPWTV